LLFTRQFSHSLESARLANQEVALLTMDLDGFKDVNDRLGHAAGDEVLRVFAGRLGRALGPGDKRFRLGGDEFAVVMAPRFGAFDSAVTTAAMVAEAAVLPLEVQGHSVSIGVSIGIAVFPEHGRESNILQRKADAAMYEAKKKHLVLAGASELGATTVMRRLRAAALTAPIR
jgi:diguanylate cyclase (GGDEF)-like protein